MRQIVICGLALGALLWIAHGSARAATSCSVGTATLTFGNFDVYGGAVPMTGTVTASCSGPQAAPVMTMSAGGSGTYADRAMACVAGSGCSSGDVLKYNIYTTASLATVLGDPAVDASTASMTFPNIRNTSQTVNIYGQVHAAVAGGMNDVSVGNYSDTLTITISF
jgi:spore coat protein U-like protein